MSREFNSAREICRRTLFALFMVCCVATFWLAVSLVVEWHWKRLLLTAAALLLAVVSYRIGMSFFAFDTIPETFALANVPPFLNPTAKAAYRQAQEILHELRQEGLQPMQRQKLRNRLSKLVAEQPDIFQLLKIEILEVHPAIHRP